MRPTLLTLLLLLPALVGATVYKSTTVDGTVIYSDTPSAGSVPVDLPPTPSWTPPPPRRQPPVKTPVSPPRPTPPEVVIIAPAAEAVIRDNSGRVEVRVQVSPPHLLGSGLYLQLELDGARLAERYRRVEMVLTDLDRGSHRLRVWLLDGQGEVHGTSSEVEFHLLRHSILFTPP